MAILRELWANNYISPEMRNVYSYFFELRNRLEKTCDIARDNLSSAQSVSAKHFNRRAKLRKLNPKDLALILLPTDENKLLMRWKGPFEIIEPIGINDYKVRIGDYIKVFHINMLRKYNERLQSTAGAAIVENASDDDLDNDPDLSSTNESWTNANINAELTPEQHTQIADLMQECSDIFSNKPGATNLVEHEIILNSDTPIRVRQYPIPHARVETFENEVKKMIEQDIIKPSQSPFRSPMLLVKKSDGSFRPVIDFRFVNKLTKFDAEPMTNSNVALGAVLLQRHSDTLFPTAYASKVLSSAQKAYSVIERECLSIVWALDKFYPYLYGTKFTIQTDHQPLIYLNTAKLTNTRLMRWAIKLQPFYFTIESITGSNNVGADYLSRC